MVVNKATPADGPSLGIAPAGTWMCKSFLFNSRYFRFKANLERIKLCEILADSFITSPSCPVNINCPLPGINTPSINSISPPTGVQANPVTTPGAFF
ncbi:hypothetical protein D3C73_1105990 [compost metagenome]